MIITIKLTANRFSGIEVNCEECGEDYSKGIVFNNDRTEEFD